MQPSLNSIVSCYNPKEIKLLKRLRLGLSNLHDHRLKQTFQDSLSSICNCRTNHCVKSVQIRSFFWTTFSCIRIKYGEMRSISPYSVRMWENTDQKKLSIWALFTQLILRQLLTTTFTVLFSLMKD